MKRTLSMLLMLVAVSASAETLVLGERRFALLDPLANEARIHDRASGREVQRVATGETPVDALFIGDRFYVLARDARTLESGGAKVEVGKDAAFLRAANGMLYVYSRADGIVEEFDHGLRSTRRVKVAPFASDLELAGKSGYLVYPAEGKIRTFSLTMMKATGEVAVGAVPTDLAFATTGNALSAATLAVADPSAKRVWLIEGEQSMTQAVTRGFLRGLLGLGLYADRESQFPTGIDRVLTRGSTWIAYDSSSGTLYRFTKKQSTVLARNVAPGSFALTGDGVALWQGGQLRMIR